MKTTTRKIENCLLCKKKKIKKLFSLGNFFVSNFVEKKNIKKGTKAPLNLLYCENCSLIQLSHIAPQEIMYRRFYWYRSGVTKIMRLGLKDIFNERGINYNKDLVFTCGSGVTACVLGLANSIISGKTPIIYDGSWAEWGKK